jgi:hypothetical protein
MPILSLGGINMYRTGFIFLSLYALCGLLHGQAIYVVGANAASSDYVAQVISKTFFRDKLAKKVVVYVADEKFRQIEVKNKPGWPELIQKSFSNNQQANVGSSGEVLQRTLEGINMRISSNLSTYYYDPITDPNVKVSVGWKRINHIELLPTFLATKKLVANSVLVINGIQQQARIELDNEFAKITTAKSGIITIRGTYDVNVGSISRFQYRSGGGNWIDVPAVNTHIQNDEEWLLDLDIRSKKSMLLEIRPIVVGVTNSVIVKYDYVSSLIVSLERPANGGQAINCKEYIYGQPARGFMFSIRCNVNPKELSAVFDLYYQSNRIVDIPHETISLNDEQVLIRKQSDNYYCVFLAYDKLFPGVGECIDPTDKYYLRFTLDGETKYSSEQFSIGFNPFNQHISQIPVCNCE